MMRGRVSSVSVNDMWRDLGKLVVRSSPQEIHN